MTNFIVIIAWCLLRHVASGGGGAPHFKKRCCAPARIKISFPCAPKMTSWDEMTNYWFFYIFLIWQKSCTLLKPLKVSTWFGKNKRAIDSQKSDLFRHLTIIHWHRQWNVGVHFLSICGHTIRFFCSVARGGGCTDFWSPIWKISSGVPPVPWFVCSWHELV